MPNALYSGEWFIPNSGEPSFIKIAKTQTHHFQYPGYHEVGFLANNHFFWNKILYQNALTVWFKKAKGPFLFVL